MATTLRKAPKGQPARQQLALEFAQHFGINGFETAPEGYEISLDAMDCWFIDNGFAEDPGCSQDDDPESLAWKGFVAQRNGAKNLINRCAKLLPEHQSYAVRPGTAGSGVYFVIQWQADSKAIAKDITKRIDTFSRNKVSGIEHLQRLAEQKFKVGQDSVEISDYLRVTQQARAALIEEQSRLLRNFEEICTESEKGIRHLMLGKSGEVA